jgi:uncharacterized protein (DUF433 family)
MATVLTPRIEKTPGVCGGEARIAGTRIPVWLLVQYRKSGVTDKRLLEFYPHLTAADLEACWDYYQHHTNELEQSLWLNDTAANVPAGTPPRAWVIVSGLLLGVPEATVREAFDPPLTADDVAAAWAKYWTNPAGVEEDIARHRRAG